MTKEEILSYLKLKQQFFYDNFGIKFVGLFGSFSRDKTIKPHIKNHLEKDLILI